MSDFSSLTRRYPLVTVPRLVGGRQYDLTYVADQDTLLDQVTDDAELDFFPFGLLLWASAIGLAEYLTANPDLVRGKRVLELGAGGVGLPGMVAAQLDATSVIQTDYHTESLTLLEHNTTRNGLNLPPPTRADWRGFPDLGQPFDLVIGSDILYERTLHPPLLALLPTLVGPGGQILISDPIRPQALAFVEQWERLSLKDWSPEVQMQSATVTEDKGQKKAIALFSLLKRKP